jgi:hypothetical protein
MIGQILGLIAFNTVIYTMYYKPWHDILLLYEQEAYHRIKIKFYILCIITHTMTYCLCEIRGISLNENIVLHTVYHNL